MNKFKRIPIERKEGITIYGRVINAKGKLGKYEVISDYWGHDGSVFATYAEAEKRRDALKILTERKNKIP